MFFGPATDDRGELTQKPELTKETHVAKRNYRSQERVARFRMNKSPAPAEVKNTKNLTAVTIDLADGIVTGTVRFIKQETKATPTEIEAALDAFLDALGVN